MQPMLRAIIYLRELRRDCRCFEYCAAKGYRVVGVIVDPDGSRYQEAREMLGGQAEIIVMCSRADIPPDAIPRLESITQDLPPVPGEETLRIRPIRRRRRPRPYSVVCLGFAFAALDAAQQVFH